MYEINFHTKISSAWFTGLSIVFSSFSGFWSIWEYEIKFHTKGFGQKSTKFFAYENFFLYSMAAKCGRQCKRPPRDGNSPFLTCILFKGKWTQRHFSWGILHKGHCDGTQAVVDIMRLSLFAIPWVAIFTRRFLFLCDWVHSHCHE